MRSPGLLACTLRSARGAFPVLIFLLAAASGCATGGTGAGPGGSGGGTTTGPGGAGSGGTGGDGGTGGTGGDTGSTTSSDTTTTSSDTTTSTTSTTTTTTTTSPPITCDGPPDVPGYGLEDEPNAIAAIATPLADGTQGFSASICPPGDIDVFAIPITSPGESLRLEIKAAGGGCPPGAATRLRLFAPDNSLVAQDTSGGDGQCSLISPQSHPAVLSLAAGTYHAQVENLDFTKIDAYVLDVLAQAPSCGDGLIQAPAGEQCDDGNTVSGDGCTGDCLIEAVCGDGTAHFVAGEQCDDSNDVSGDGCSSTCQLEAVLLAEVEPNTEAMPNSLAGYHGAIGSIQPGSDTDWYSFDVTVPGSSVTISTSDGLGGCPGIDTRIWLYAADGAPLADDDEDGAGSCSLISPLDDAGAANLGVGTYKIKVEDYGNNSAIEMYVLKINVGAPGCGDSILQGNEQCDDGNTAAGDGCSDVCVAEAPWEIEPNGVQGKATAQWPGFALWSASIQPSGDEDWFSFTVQAGQSVTLDVHAAGAPGSCPSSFDTVMSLVDAAGVPVVDDDDDGMDLCSMISPALDPEVASLAAGTYFVRVQPFGGMGAAGPYELGVLVQ